MVYQEVEKDVNKVVDEDNVVDKKLNEGTQLEDGDDECIYTFLTGNSIQIKRHTGMIADICRRYAKKFS